MKQLLLMMMAVVLVGCASPSPTDYSAQDLSKLNVGMTKEQVIAVKGEPYERAVNGDTEYLIYAVGFTDIYGEFRANKKKRYYVRLSKGKVNSFGKVGDFDSTQDPTLKLIIEKRRR